MYGGRDKYITAEVYVFVCDPLLPEQIHYNTQCSTCRKVADFLTKILYAFCITSLINATCLTHLILLGATSKLVKSSFYQLNGFTYRTGLVPMVRITLRAMRLCKLQCSTAIAAMRPPAQYLTSPIMSIKLNHAVLYQWFYATFNTNFQILVNIN